MRQYLDQDKKTLEKVVCNRCGRELKLINGIVQEGVFQGRPVGATFPTEMESIIRLIYAKSAMNICWKRF